MNIVDEKLVSYLGESARVPTNEKVFEQSEEEAEITMKISAERSTKYVAYGFSTKELFFQYKA
jgi:hypothetical protein